MKQTVIGVYYRLYPLMYMEYDQLCHEIIVDITKSEALSDIFNYRVAQLSYSMYIKEYNRYVPIHFIKMNSTAVVARCIRQAAWDKHPACSWVMLPQTPSARRTCDGRVVKALDLKSSGIYPRRFESCSRRTFWVVLVTRNSQQTFWVVLVTKNRQRVI